MYIIHGVTILIAEFITESLEIYEITILEITLVLKMLFSQIYAPILTVLLFLDKIFEQFLQSTFELIGSLF